MRPFNSRRLIFTVYDLMAVATACALGIALRLDGIPTDWRMSTLIFSGTALVVSLAVFPLVGINRGHWRYASLRDILAIVYGSTLTLVLAVIGLFFITRLQLIPRSSLIIAWMMMVLLLSAPRVALRAYREKAFSRLGRRNASPDTDQRNLVVIGVNDEVEAFLRFLNRRRKPEYNVLAILEPTARYWGRQLRGVPILHIQGSVQETLRQARIEGQVHGFLMPHGRIPNKDLQDILDHAAAHRLKLYRLPDRLPNPYESRGLLENIRIEDLLQRDPAAIDIAGIEHLLDDKTVLVTGCGGTIGSTLVKFIMSQNIRRLVLIDHSEFAMFQALSLVREGRLSSVGSYICSVTDRSRIEAIMGAEKPDFIFHAAAMKHVDLVEQNAAQGILTNVFGTRVMADAAMRHDAEAFVLISTDKAVSPSSVMGASKRVAERYVQLCEERSTKTRFITVRFGNVLGSSGSAVPIFERQIKKGGPVTVTDPNVERYFMTAEEARMLIMHATLTGMKAQRFTNRICVLDMGDPVRIDDLARKMILLSGKIPNEDIPITYTGLRPGEKLRERLVDHDEQLLPEESTDGVLVVQCRPISIGEFIDGLKALRRACQNTEGGPIKSALAYLVPSNTISFQ